jgi:hypothetical protein
VASFLYQPSYKFFYLFQKVGPFDGWLLESGMLPREGPYPKFNLPRIQWGLGPRSRLRTDSLPAGQATLHVSLRNLFPDQVLTFRLDGQLVAQQAVPAREAFYEFTVPINLNGETQTLQIDYAKWEQAPEVPRAVMFQRLQIEPVR